ncbi:conserved exported hypothetical protein [Vibrio chagasii]|nr:conserved exported hypothetical protein [Vibrio chagasii]
MKFKLILPIALLSLCNSSLATSCTDILKLSNEQKDILNISYHEGHKKDLGLTLAAIAWHESHFGKYLVALEEGSVGVHHINIKTAIVRSKMRDTPINRSYLATTIIKDPYVSADYAIRELEYWKSQGRSWRDMVKSYNAGWNIEHGQAHEYLEYIMVKLKTLDECKDIWYKPYI